MYTYKYPRPMVTVDILLFRLTDNALEVLLIQRKNDPFKQMWALPGGFIEMDEPLIDAAMRELAEETGVGDIPLIELGTFGDPGRDPRGRTITVLYGGVVDSEIIVTAGDDAGDARWSPVNVLPELAFDHNAVIDLGRIRFFETAVLDKSVSSLLPAGQYKTFLNGLMQFEKLSPAVMKVVKNSRIISVNGGKLKWFVDT